MALNSRLTSYKRLKPHQRLDSLAGIARRNKESGDGGKVHVKAGFMDPQVHSWFHLAGFIKRLVPASPSPPCMSFVAHWQLHHRQRAAEPFWCDHISSDSQAGCGTRERQAQGGVIDPAGWTTVTIHQAGTVRGHHTHTVQLTATK